MTKVTLLIPITLQIGCMGFRSSALPFAWWCSELLGFRYSSSGFGFRGFRDLGLSVLVHR